MGPISFANVAIVIYYPTYATGLGYPLSIAGAAIAVYEVGAVAGTFTGGILSDRHGRARTIPVGLVAELPPLVGAVALGSTWAGLSLLFVAGFLWLSASSVEPTLRQQLLPNNRSAAVGLTYFMRAAGAIVATTRSARPGTCSGSGQRCSLRSQSGRWRPASSR